MKIVLSCFFKNIFQSIFFIKKINFYYSKQVQEIMFLFKKNLYIIDY